jgi:hypothetical protein
VIGGDFNETRTAADANGSSHRRHGRLIDLLIPEYADVIRCFRPRATRADATYLDPRGSWSRLDHLLFRPEINGRYPSRLLAADMRDLPALRSRHRAVICTLEVNDSSNSAENKAAYTPRYFRVANSSRAQKEAYAERVNIRLEPWVKLAPDIADHGDLVDVASLCDNFTAIILTVAEQELGVTSVAWSCVCSLRSIYSACIACNAGGPIWLRQGAARGTCWCGVRSIYLVDLHFVRSHLLCLLQHAGFTLLTRRLVMFSL